MHIRVKKGDSTIYDRYFTEGDLLEEAVKDKVLSYVVLEGIAQAEEIEIIRVKA